MKTARLALATALGASLAVPAAAGLSTASAAGLAKARPLTVTDAKGDANFLNSQNGIAPVPEQSNEAVNQKAADILSFTLGRKDDGKTVKSFIGTMTLAAPPEAGYDYRIRMKTEDCGTYFLELEQSPALAPAAYVRENCGGATTSNFTPTQFSVSGNTITWIVPAKRLPGTAKLGTVLTVTGAQTSRHNVAVIFPGVDQVVTDKTFVIGQ